MKNWVKRGVMEGKKKGEFLGGEKEKYGWIMCVVVGLMGVDEDRRRWRKIRGC